MCGGRGDLHVKDRIKTIEVREKKLEEADKVGGGSDYSCAGLGKKRVLLPIRGQIFCKFLERLSYE